MEARRVMQSTAFVMAYARRDIDRGLSARGNKLLQQMNRVLLGEATATELGPQMQCAALEVSKHPFLGKEAEATTNAVWLARSIQQLVKLEQFVQAKQQVASPKPKSEAPAQQAPRYRRLKRQV